MYIMAYATPEEVIQRLRPKPRAGMSMAPSSVMNLTYSHSFGDKELIYVINNESTGKSYLCPADDELDVVIGEYDKSDNVYEMPSNMVAWLESCEEEIGWWQNEGGALYNQSITDNPVYAASSSAISYNDISPLIQTQWGQNLPFNRNLINSNGNICMTGCPSIVLGQLLFYWAQKGYIRGCVSTPSRTWKNTTWQSLPSISFFDFDNMLYKYDENSSEKSKKAVAEMIEYLGKAVKTEYEPSRAGQYTQYIYPEIENSIRLCEKAKDDASEGYKYKSGFSIDTLRDVLLKNLNKGQPVIVAGHGTGGAHIFLCDGYRAKDDMFHFNWGFHGKYDDYYKLSALTPGKYNFNSSKTYAADICPKYKLGDVNADNKLDKDDILSVYHNIGKIVTSNDINLDVDYDFNVSEKDAETIAELILKDMDERDKSNADTLKLSSVLCIKKYCREISDRLDRIRVKMNV